MCKVLENAIPVPFSPFKVAQLRENANSSACIASSVQFLLPLAMLMLLMQEQEAGQEAGRGTREVGGCCRVFGW